MFDIHDLEQFGAKLIWAGGLGPGPGPCREGMTVCGTGGTRTSRHQRTKSHLRYTSKAGRDSAENDKFSHPFAMNLKGKAMRDIISIYEDAHPTVPTHPHSRPLPIHAPSGW